MTQDDLYINGELLRLRREARGWVIADLATRACMSVKQIRQLEEGGTSAFYSAAVKLTAAKKVAALLGASQEEVLAPTQAIQSEFQDAVSLAEAVTEEEPKVSYVSDAQPKPVSAEPLAVPRSADVAADEKVDNATTDGAGKSKTSWLTIVSLFVLALLAAAYFQPKPEVVVEPPPPVQAIPPEPTDAASAASTAEGAASEPSVMASAPAVVQAPASGVARTTTPATSAPVVARAASAAASTASK